MPREGILFLAVPDGAVREMAARVAAMGPAEGLAVVHVSGSQGLEVLDALTDRPVGSFHPLQSFPFPRDASAFRGITVAVDASTPGLLRSLQRLARQLGARPRRVSGAERVKYHAAAVFASNFVDAVVAQGVHELESIGWTRAEATAALVPLLEGAVENIKRKGTVKALTGPIRRGDAETVSRHLEAVERPDVYRILALIALDIAREAGLDPAAVARVRRALTRDVAATRRRKRR